MYQHNHFAIDSSQRWPDALLNQGRAQVNQLDGALLHIGVRVFLVADHEVGVVQHGLAQVVVRIDPGADDHVRADDLTRACQKVTLTVVIAVGHHGTVQS